MPVLRDLYPGSKKSTSAYLPAYSLSIAAQPLSCRLCRNHLHNTLRRVTIQTTQKWETLPVRHRWIFTKNRAGSVFDHIDYHRRCWNTRKQWRQERQRVSKTNWKWLKIAVNERKKCLAPLWEQDAVGSSPATRTKIEKHEFPIIKRIFVLFFLFSALQNRAKQGKIVLKSYANLTHFLACDYRCVFRWSCNLQYTKIHI